MQSTKIIKANFSNIQTPIFGKEIACDLVIEAEMLMWHTPTGMIAELVKVIHIYANNEVGCWTVDWKKFSLKERHSLTACFEFAALAEA